MSIYKNIFGANKGWFCLKILSIVCHSLVRKGINRLGFDQFYKARLWVEFQNLMANNAKYSHLRMLCHKNAFRVTWRTRLCLGRANDVPIFIHPRSSNQFYAFLKTRFFAKHVYQLHFPVTVSFSTSQIILKKFPLHKISFNFGSFESN